MTEKKLYIVPNRRTVTSGMKAILVFIFVFLLSANIYEQKASPVNVYRNTNVNYTGIVESDQPLGYKQIREWKKFKTLQVCGWTALGAGSAMVVVGSFVFAFATEDKWDGDGVRVRLLLSPVSRCWFLLISISEKPRAFRLPLPACR